MIVGSQHPPEKIFSENGEIQSIDIPLKQFLNDVLAKKEKFGVTRIANISYLQPGGVQVHQTSRPYLMGHYSYGNNAGGQGKDFDPDKAMIKALMESHEGFSAEPREARVIRGSYEFLKHHHAVIDPDVFKRYAWKSGSIKKTNLGFTPAMELLSRQKVWIPAELVYFPYYALDYRTFSHYSASSDGQASGPSYLHTVLTGLLESLERGIEELASSEVFEFRRLDLNTFDIIQSPEIGELLEDLELYCFLISSKNQKIVPTVMSFICHQNVGHLFAGTCSSTTVESALFGAVTEAAQSRSTILSGSREDVQTASGYVVTEEGLPKSIFKSKELLSRVQAENLVLSLPEHPRQTLPALLEHLKVNDTPSIFVANLTRIGVDIPSTKVVLPKVYGHFPKFVTTKALSPDSEPSHSSWSAENQKNYIDRIHD